MQLALALVFLGFDYSFGLSLLSASFYMAFRTATRNAAVACDVPALRRLIDLL